MIGATSFTAVGEPTNQEIMDQLNIIYDKLENITARMDSLNNSTQQSIEYINESIDDLNFSSVTTLQTRLEIIDDMVTQIDTRLGYPSSKPDANIYDDLSLILDGLTFENNGTRQWLLKNDSGRPYIQVLGENQQIIAEYQLTQTDAINTSIGNAQESILDKQNTRINDVLGAIGTNFWVIIVVLIIGIFFIAWKFFLQNMFAQQTSGRPMQAFGADGRPNLEGAGRPQCFGDPNKFDPGNDPDCVSCPWVGKCQTAVMRELPAEAGGRETAMEPKYDYNGNIVAILDEGQPIQLPGCFGREYDPNNRDCQECAIKAFCSKQQQKNQQIQAPPQPQPQQQSPAVRSPGYSRRGMHAQQQRTTQGGGSNILDAF